MIVNHLSRVMGERRINMQQLAQRAGVSYTTVFNLYHDRATRYDRHTLDRLCAVLGVTLCDLLEYQPESAP